MLDPKHLWTLVFAVYGLASLASFFVMGWDKRAALKETRRVPERVLHLLELLGGWPGAFVAMAVWKHKRRKPSFLVVTILIALAHALVWLWLMGAIGS
jgi:uncharacterized membrane protein YsdA (DUF1294 family)